MIDYVKDYIAPRDFDPKKIDDLRRCYFDQFSLSDNLNAEDILEGLMANWVIEHLQYVSWYAKVPVDYDVKLSDLLKVPRCLTDPSRRAYERTLYVRYGIL